ncbi:MAG: hypothetical protein JWM80_6224 [Cyanobacteria bacterium RYN_339]|nr:hypothetical protein [Cyanobacteria bacterium RYN_339]
MLHQPKGTEPMSLIRSIPKSFTPPTTKPVTKDDLPTKGKPEAAIKGKFDDKFVPSCNPKGPLGRPEWKKDPGYGPIPGKKQPDPLGRPEWMKDPGYGKIPGKTKGTDPLGRPEWMKDPGYAPVPKKSCDPGLGIDPTSVIKQAGKISLSEKLVQAAKDMKTLKPENLDVFKK